MPLISQVKIDLMLTNVSIQFKNPGYIAEEVVPIIPVKLETSKYFVYDKTRFDIPKTLRAEQAQYARINWAPTTQTYSCNEHALEHLIDDRERQNAIEPLNLDIDGTEIITDMILNDREQRVANMLTASANYTHSNYSDLNGLATAWDQFGTSDPIKDIAVTGRERVRANSGLYPNTLILSAKVASYLDQHPVIIDRLKYNAQGGVAVSYLDALAKIFKVDRVVIGSALYRSSNENQTDALTDIWGNHAVLAYINQRPAIKQPTLAYMFQSRPRMVEKYREDNRKSDVLRCSEVVDEKMVSDSCGYLFRNVVA